MSRTMIARYVNPWKFRREEQEQRLRALRDRLGENCSRCRRPIRFDLPGGHDQAPRIEQLLHAANGGSGELDNLCLTHTRCNSAGADHTPEVTERIRRRSEAELLSRSRKRA
jgi:hypothetical protein